MRLCANFSTIQQVVIGSISLPQSGGLANRTPDNLSDIAIHEAMPLSWYKYTEYNINIFGDVFITVVNLTNYLLAFLT